MVKKKGDYIDCYKCRHHSLLYDYHLSHTTVKGHWCSARNGRIRKRFRGDCQFVMKGGAE